MNDRYDVVIVGGGAAGLGGALSLSRARRSVLVVDAGRPRNAPADHMHNYLGREGADPRELLAIGRDEVARYGTEFVDGEDARGAVTSGQDSRVDADLVGIVHADTDEFETVVVDELGQRESARVPGADESDPDRHVPMPPRCVNLCQW